MANIKTINQIKTNPFVHFFNDTFTIEKLDKEYSECRKLYSGFGICWFRSVMQIFLYVDDFEFKCTDNKNVKFTLETFLNQLKKEFDLKTNCYKCTGLGYFHIENVYAYVIYFLSLNISKITNDEIQQYNNEINKRVPWYFTMVRSDINKLYVNLDGAFESSILINTFILLNYLLSYQGKPCVIRKQIYKRFINIDTNNNLNLKDKIKVLSYSSNIIDSPHFEHVSTFKSILNLFTSQKKDGIRVRVRDHHNMLALFVQIDTIYYQLFAMSIANSKSSFFADGHILSIMEDKVKRFPFFSGAELPTFDLLDSLHFKNSKMDSVWNDMLNFSYDLGFRECFYKICDEHDIHAYYTFEKIIKLMHSPVPCKIALDYLLVENDYFEVNKNSVFVKCKSPFEGRFQNYILSMNAKMIDALTNDDDAVRKLLDYCINLDNNITGFDNDLKKYIEFKKDVSIRDKSVNFLSSSKICELLQKAQSNKHLKHAFENYIQPGSETIIDIYFCIENIRMHVSFVTLLWWLNMSSNDTNGATDTNAISISKPQKINNLLYYFDETSSYCDIVSVFELILLHNHDDIFSEDDSMPEMNACMDICRNIKGTNGTNGTKEESIEIITKLVTEFVKTYDTKYQMVVVGDDNLFTLSYGKLYLDELFDALEISKQDNVLYYFIIAINAYTKKAKTAEIAEIAKTAETAETANNQSGGAKKKNIVGKMKRKYRRKKLLLSNN